MAFYGMMRGLGLLPLRVLYGLGDALAWLASEVVRYRRGVVADNLRTCFPEKSVAELKKLSRAFYRYLADYFMETAKLSGMSRRQIVRRMRYDGMEAVNADLQAGRNVVLYLGHYGNWEWISSLPLHLLPEVESGQIYHPLENKGADEAFLRLRGRFGARSIPMRDTLRVLLGHKAAGRPSITGFIADQAPGYDSMHLFVDFLGRDTPAITGPEKIARKLKAAVYYCDVSRPRRGYYECRMVKMADDASALPLFELTRGYYACLDATIRRRPELWLWSHRRWKRTRRAFMDLYGDEAAERLTHL